MNVTFSNKTLQDLNDQSVWADYKSSVNESKNSRRDYFMLRGGDFKTEPKPSWCWKQRATIDNTRLTFLRAVVSEYVAAKDLTKAKGESSAWTGSVEIENADVKTLKAFVKEKFPENLKNALKIYDYDTLRRIPLSKFRVKAVMDELKGIVSTAQSEKAELDFWNKALDTEKKAGELKNYFDTQFFNKQSGTSINSIKNSPIKEISNVDLNAAGVDQKRVNLVKDLKKFYQLFKHFFGDGKTFIDNQEHGVFSKQLKGGALPTDEEFEADLRDILENNLYGTVPAKDKDGNAIMKKCVLTKWKSGGCAYTRWLAPIVNGILEGNEKRSFPKVIMGEADEYGRSELRKRLSSWLDADNETFNSFTVVDAFEKSMEYVFEDFNPVFSNVEKINVAKLHQALTGAEGAEREDGK